MEENKRTNRKSVGMRTAYNAKKLNAKSPSYTEAYNEKKQNNIAAEEKDAFVSAGSYYDYSKGQHAKSMAGRLWPGRKTQKNRDNSDNPPEFLNVRETLDNTQRIPLSSLPDEDISGTSDSHFKTDGKFSGVFGNFSEGHTGGVTSDGCSGTGSSARHTASGSSGRRVRSNPSIKRNSRFALLKKRKALLIKGIVALLILAGIIVAIVAISNGAKNGGSEAKQAETTTAVNETETETVTVTEQTTTAATIVKPENWNGKTVYLTFDDGPSSVTDPLLEVLGQYNVKATFFVLGNSSQEQYKKIVDQGHAIGVHSTSHDYDIIYASMENFQNDVQTLKTMLEQYTGQEIYLYRFPGGSNNLVHQNAGNMTMTQFADYINSIGMKYVDWNADSGDAEYVTADVDTIYNKAKADIDYWGGTDQNTIVLLMHDAETKTTGPEMLGRLIPQLLAEGYAFDKITRDTPDIHFELPD